MESRKFWASLSTRLVGKLLVFSSIVRNLSSASFLSNGSTMKSISLLRVEDSTPMASRAYSSVNDFFFRSSSGLLLREGNSGISLSCS